MYLIAGRSRSRGGSGAGSRDSPADRGDLFDNEPHDFGVSDYDDGNGDGDSGPDDPELLSQLEALRAEIGMSAPPPRSKPKTEQSGMQFGDDDDDDAIDNVQVTEEDMTDPLLLAELSKLTAKTADTESALHEAPLPTVQPSVAGSDGEPTLDQLAARQQQLKTAALAAKRQGDIDRARELLVQMKDVQASIKLLQPSQQLTVNVPSPLVPEIGQHEPSVNLEAQSPATSPALSRARGAPVNATQAPRLARSMPRQPTVSTAAATIHGSNNAPAPLPRMELGDSVMSFATMKAELELQVAKASRLATYFLKAGNKPAALEFHRAKKRATTDLATVSSYEANGRSLPPPFLYKEVQWNAPAEQRRDISASELQIVVGRMVSDGDLAATLGGKSDFYIQWELPWPRDRGHKAYTRTLKHAEFEASCGDLDVGYSHNVDFVDRQHTRPLVRWLDRGRLTIELYKYMGLLWGSQLVGRASLSLSDLRTKSEAAALLEIKATKPLPGGPVYIDVAARLRLPLSNKPEIESHAERWIYIESQDQQAQPAFVSVESKTSLPTEKSAAVHDEPTEKNAALHDEPTEKGATVHDEPTSNNTSADDIATMLDTMDSLVSNATLELELSQLPARMKDAGDKESAEQIRDLEAAIKLRMTVIAAQVGAGLLSIQEYIDSVSAELARAKEWALIANRAGRKDLALRALKRVKAMQSELDEMTAAMDAESG
ncbi:hypothetical protein GGI20_001910 [Coemansia sp. BCRC 34301]|nr:hypothetical protein GGI20_001910 [Coemansia sp. BCRC 34301]